MEIFLMMLCVLVIISYLLFKQYKVATHEPLQDLTYKQSLLYHIANDFEHETELHPGEFTEIYLTIPDYSLLKGIELFQPSNLAFNYYIHTHSKKTVVRITNVSRQVQNDNVRYNIKGNAREAIYILKRGDVLCNLIMEVKKIEVPNNKPITASGY